MPSGTRTKHSLKGAPLDYPLTGALVVAAAVVVLLLTVPVAQPSLAAAGPSGTVARTMTEVVPVGVWPTYMQNPERTGANFAENTIAPSNVSGLLPVWSLTSNGSDFSAPIVVNGTVYYGSWNGYEYAVNGGTGNVLWSHYLGTDPACGGYTPMGISSTAAYAADTLYLGGGNGYWYALNATNGHTDWEYFVGNGSDGFYDWASALVYHHSLYIGIASCFDEPLVPAGLLDLNVSGASPTLSERFNTTPPNLTGESLWTTPALDPQNNTLWLSTGNENPPGYPLYANAIIGLNATTLNVSGSWQVPNVQGEDSDFGSTPTLIQAGPGAPLVVASNKNGVAYALNRSNVSASGSWAPVWNLSTGGGFSGGAFDGHMLYLAGGNTVNAVYPANGTVAWTAGMVGGGTILGSLSWANGLVYAAGGSYIEAIDAANGTVLWNHTLPGGDSGVTEPVVSNGRLYVASGNYGAYGNLTAFGLPLLANASASKLNGSAPFRVNFTAQAHGGMTPYSFRWTFGDGGTASGPSTSHTYASGGTFTVRAWVNDSSNGSKMFVWLVTVTGGSSSGSGWLAVLALIVAVAAVTIVVAVWRTRRRPGPPENKVHV